MQDFARHVGGLATWAYCMCTTSMTNKTGIAMTCGVKQSWTHGSEAKAHVLNKTHKASSLLPRVHLVKAHSSSGVVVEFREHDALING